MTIFSQIRDAYDNIICIECQRLFHDKHLTRSSKLTLNVTYDRSNTELTEKFDYRCRCPLGTDGSGRLARTIARECDEQKECPNTLSIGAS